MRKSIVVILTLFVVFGQSVAQIRPNEKLVYAASYNMSGLMTQLAQVSMETSILNTTKKSYLHLSLSAETFSKWDSFFKIRDLYESYVNPVTLKPSLYNRSIYEGGYYKTEKYIFNLDGKSINSTSQVKRFPVSKQVVRIGANSVDAVTLIYKLRTVNFNALRVGQVLPMIMIFDDKEFKVYIKYLGVQTISTSVFGRKSCFKLSISANSNKLKGRDRNLIWLTDDARKIPVLIQFSIPVGTGELKLVSVR